MNNQSGQEDQLVARALAGDTAAFGSLYERYLDAIYHYVFYRVEGHQEAEDLTELVFLRAWQALENSPPREIPFRLWLYRIAHNAVVDHYRTRKEQLGLEAAAHIPTSLEGPEASLARQEQAEILKRAMLLLKEEHQQVLTCRFVVGLSHAETAVIMQRNEGAVRALQYRAIVALRSRLVAEGNPHV